MKKKLQSIVTNLLKTRSEEPATGGPGEILLPCRRGCQEECICVESAPIQFVIKKKELTTSSPLLKKIKDSAVGTFIVNDYYAAEMASKYSADSATLQKHEKRMKDENNKGRKDDSEKPMLAYIPKAALEAEGKAFSYGASKYAAWNYKRGIAISRTLSAALRQIGQFLAGEDIDGESNVNHLGCARANLAMALDTLENHPEMDDRYKEPK